MTTRSRVVVAVMMCFLLLCSPAVANNIFFDQTVFATDFVSAGVGGFRNVGNGVITLAGVSGTVNRAYLYWHGPTNSANPAAGANVLVNGNPVMGMNIGFSNDNCWGFLNSQAYRADVTALVQGTGNGAYSLTGFGAGAVNTNGASLIVFFDDGNSLNNRDVVIFHGNDSNINNSFDAPGWNVTLAGINYTAGTGNMQLHVADGQAFIDAALILNAATLVPQGPIFQGTSVPSANNGPTGNGSLWDIRSFDVTSFLAPGPNVLNLQTGVFSDCLALVVALVDLPAGAAPEQPNQPPMITCQVEQTVECASPAGTSLELTAVVCDADGDELTVTWTVDGGPVEQTDVVPAGGPPTMATLSFTRTYPEGTSVVTATVDDGTTEPVSCDITVNVVDTTPPDVVCSAANTVLWPPNHNLENVGLTASASDICDGDNLPVTISVYADEDDEEATGDGNHSPDARNIDLGTLRLRKERKGDADGRVYLIVASATDASGNTGTACCTVVVPHSQSPASISAVLAQAIAAESFCLENGTAPPGFFVVGDGPVIGPKQ